MVKTDLKDLILEKSNIGIWMIEIDKGRAPRMKADTCMRSLLGMQETLSPEETYNVWYDNIHPDHYDALSTCMEKMIAGNHAEIQLPWQHPQRGSIFVRCGGIRDESYEYGIRLHGSCQDVTNIYQLNKDELTGLYKKEYFFKKVKEILAENPNTDYRIMVSDVEDFKLINEKYGVDVADALLKYLANSIKKLLPENYIIGARLNADKFVCLQYGKAQTREEGLQLEAQVVKNAPIPNLIWKHGIYYTSFDRTLSVQSMCDRARFAVDSIKGVYGVKCAVYNEKMRQSLLLRQQITENMEEALEKKEFKVYLQPKHNLHTDKTGGAEALIRWIHPTAGFMNPGMFIPVFEKNGFIVQLDMYVVKTVCKILRKWIDTGKEVVPISVNLSRRDFEQPGLADYIVEVVDFYGISHDLLHIEITESVFSDNPELTAEIISRFHKSGFVIELDDFGTGYSSLMTLNDLELDVIKLDMSLVQKDKPRSDKSVLDFCVQLAKMMHLQSVAEGVETREQLERIKSIGCDYIQGYYFSKPLPINEFERYINGDEK